MRLRSKLILTIAAVSVIPVTAASLVGSELVRRSSQAEFQRLLRDGKVEVLSRYRLLQEEVCRDLDRLADPEDRFIGRILLARARGGLDDETFRDLAEETPRVMEGRGLDVLSVLSDKGEILACGHFPGRMGDTEPAYAAVAKDYTKKGALLLRERVLIKGKPVTRLTVQAWRAVSSSLGARAVVMGGRRLGPSFVRGLRLRGGTVVRILDPGGETLAGPRDWTRYRGYPQHEIPLQAPDGKEAARVVLAVPDDALRTTLKLINYTAVTLAGTGLLLALLLGAVTARRITRPVQEVVEGAEAVGRGELDVQLKVRSRDEMGQLVQAFNRSVKDLKEAREKLLAAERVAAWREIARRIAHEIKNPLFPIQTSIETLQKVYKKQHPDFEEIFAESTTTILEEVQRLKNIVTEFSRFARMPKPRLEPCDPLELLRQVINLYGGDGAPIRSSLPQSLPRVMADREQLTQVLVNLIQNAREAVLTQSDQDPRIEVMASEDEQWLTIAVEDNGPGFDQETAVRIFTPYFTTKHSSGGTGLGLAIAQRIVNDHGGRLEAVGNPGKGATFTIRLPLG